MVKLRKSGTLEPFEQLHGRREEGVKRVALGPVCVPLPAQGTMTVPPSTKTR
jgi:hypothetical protein